MAFWNKKPTEVAKEIVNPDSGGSNYEVGEEKFTSAFRPIQKGDIALPYIEQQSKTYGGAILFGKDNFFPQLLDQLYHASVLSGSIIDFKQLCTVGAGYYWEGLDELDVNKQIEIFKFIQQTNLDNLVDSVAFDLFTHERATAKIKFDNKKPYCVEFVRSQKVRKNIEGNFIICEDWTTGRNVYQIEKYERFKVANEMMLEEMKQGNSDVYPIPRYASSNNWQALEFESSVLHKSNIYESIFPSYALKFPKKPKDKAEKDEIQRQVNNMKGPRNANKVLVLFANGKELMPEIDLIPSIQNDKLFLQTDERTDSKICQAHIIDPLIMGIRVSGKLGSGTDIEKAVAIFQRVHVVPKKKQVEKFINQLLYIFGIYDVKFKLNDFNILDYVKEVNGIDTTEPTEPTEEKSEKNVNETNVNVNANQQAQAQLRGSVGGVQGILSVQQSVAQGLTERSSAIEILMSIFGFDKGQSERLLGDVKEGD